MLSDEQLVALASPENQPKQRDEFDFSDDDAALAPSPRLKEKRKKKRRSSDGSLEEDVGKGAESRHRRESRNEEQRLPTDHTGDSDDEPVVSRLEEQANAFPAPSTSPPRETVRRKRVVTAAGSSDSDGDLGVGSKQRAEPTPVTEVRKRRPVVLSDDDE
jgi:hypothetical protein